MISRRGIGGLLVIGVLLLLDSALPRAQADRKVVRSWSCLASSARGSIFGGGGATDPACLGSVDTWQRLAGRMRAADVIAPPAPPTGLTASVFAQTVVLIWAPSSAGGAPTSYVVQAGSASGLANLANSGTGSSSPTLTATGVPPGVYYVRVLAQNASGASAPSNEVVVTVAGGCGLVPAVPTGLATSSSGSNVTITWQTPAVGCAPTSYIIQAGSAPGLSNLANFSTGNTETSFSASGVGAGSYYIRVLASNAAGTGGPSPDVLLIVGGGGCGAAPGASPGLSVSVSATTVTFAWLAAPGSPSSYILQAGSTSGSSDLAVVNTGNALSYTATGVPSGTYYVRVVATNACGNGPASNEVTATVGGPSGAILTALHGFVGAPGDGSNWSTITQGADGNFYGTTSEGPAVFRMTPSSCPGPACVTFLTNLGGGSYGKLIQATDGNFYGTTAAGGAGTCSADRAITCIPRAGSGTVFKMTPAGDLTTLKVFDGGADGSKPYGGLIQATDGNLYGTTQSGASGFGTVFRIRTDGTFTTLHRFTGGDADGANPYAPLTQGSDGNLYGSTTYGTRYNVGTVFKITTAGAFALLHTFTGFTVPDEAPRPGIPLDGAYPAAPLVQMADGRLVGVTGGGGALVAGTAFTITSAGAYSQVAVFSGNAEGSSPIWLIRASDGNFYGNCQYGGVINMGAIFKMTPP